MSKLQIAQRLYNLSVLALIEANTGNPFIDKKEAVKSINKSRQILKNTRANRATV